MHYNIIQYTLKGHARWHNTPLLIHNIVYILLYIILAGFLYLCIKTSFVDLFDATLLGLAWFSCTFTYFVQREYLFKPREQLFNTGRGREIRENFVSNSNNNYNSLTFACAKKITSPQVHKKCPLELIFYIPKFFFSRKNTLFIAFIKKSLPARHEWSYKNFNPPP